MTEPLCFCIESALKGVAERKLPGANCCRLCQGLGCNSPKHPGILARPLAKRLQRGPYCLSGVSAARYARKLAAAENLKRLKEGWEREARGEVKAVVGHCARCSRYLPLDSQRRCAYCDRV